MSLIKQIFRKGDRVRRNSKIFTDSKQVGTIHMCYGPMPGRTVNRYGCEVRWDPPYSRGGGGKSLLSEEFLEFESDFDALAAVARGFE